MASLFRILRTIATTIAAGLVVCTACTPESAEVAVKSIALDETSIVLFPGDSHSFIVTVTPDNATDKKVNWTSSNPSAVTVSEDGVAIAVEVGKSTITATSEDGGKTATCEVEVMAKRVNVSGVKLNKTSTVILRGHAETLEATVEPDNASVKDVTWESSNPEVATVDAGVVSALALGTTTITVTTKDGNKTASCEVTVDADSFTVQFETNGAGTIAPVTVNKNDKLTAPEDPVKADGIDPGLYVGKIDPDSGSSVFVAWYTEPEFTNEYDFETPVTSDFTLYAKWDSSDSPVVVDTEESPLDLKTAVEWLNENAVSKSEYTLVLASDKSSGNFAFNADATLYVVGQKEARTLTMRFYYSDIKANKIADEVYTNPHLVFGKNVTVTGNGIELFRIGERAKLTLSEGAKISGCDAGTQLGLIYVNSNTGYFILDGGEIVENKVTSRTDGFNHAAIICSDNGCVTINSGRIANNTVTAGVPDAGNEPKNPTLVAGAILSNAASWNGDAFSKNGGVIENNKAVLPDGVTGYAGDQVMATFRDVFNPIYVVNANINGETNFKVNTWDAPWVCVRNDQ